MTKHAKLSPSASHRWLNCTGSVRQCEGLESPDSSYSREGTFAHAIAARCLLEGKAAKELIGETDGEFTCDAEMASHVQVYVDVVRALEMVYESELFVEQGVVLFDELVYGTADAVLISPDSTRVDVVDLKFGAGILVGAVENTQLLIYGLAALRALPMERRQKIREVHLHIVQPRRPDADGGAHRTWSVPEPELQKMHQRVLDAVQEIQQTGGKLVTGEHCTFCPAAATCPALHEEALQAARDVFPTGDPMAPVKPPHASTLSADQLAKLLESADIVETWIQAIRDHAFDRAQNGVKIPGYKLVEKIGNRKWISESAAILKLREAGVDPYEDPKIVSPAQAEKRLGKRLAPIIGPLTHRPTTGICLAPESDKRPELNPAAVFTVLPG